MGWWKGRPAFGFRARQPSGERRRHVRKYLRGDPGPARFVFTGPRSELRQRE
jgi:hypothetical protein